MPFETVRLVPNSVLKGKEGEKYLREEDLSGLERHNLLYFLKRGRCLPLYDYPVMGGFEQRLISSSVEGPFESRPETGEVDDASIERVIELLVPIEEMPVEFEDVSFVQYGTLTDRDSLSAAGAFYGHLIVDTEKILEKGKAILDRLHTMGKVEEGDDYYRIVVNGCVVGLRLHDFPDWPMPSLWFEAFGRGDVPQELLGELRLGEIKDYITGKYSQAERDLCLHSSGSRGLAYSLVLNGDEVQKVISGSNVVL